MKNINKLLAILLLVIFTVACSNKEELLENEVITNSIKSSDNSLISEIDNMSFEELTNFIEVKSIEYGIDIIKLSKENYLLPADSILNNNCFWDKITNKEISNSFMNTIIDTICNIQKYYNTVYSINNTEDSIKISNTLLFLFNTIECRNYSNMDELLNDKTTNYFSSLSKLSVMNNQINENYPSFSNFNDEKKADILTLALIYKRCFISSKAAPGQSGNGQSAAVNRCYRTFENQVDRAFAVFYVVASGAGATMTFGGPMGLLFGGIGLGGAFVTLYAACMNYCDQLDNCLHNAY